MLLRFYWSKRKEHLKLILEENIDNAEIIDKSQTAHSCDLLLNRNNKPAILIENKVYTHKVPTTEINKFKSDCKGFVISTHPSKSAKAKFIL